MIRSCFPVGWFSVFVIFLLFVAGKSEGRSEGRKWLGLLGWFDDFSVRDNSN